jgi:hypothetical protein
VTEQPIVELKVVQYGEEDEHGEVNLTGYKLQCRRAGSSDWENVEVELKIKRVGYVKKADR